MRRLTALALLLPTLAGAAVPLEVPCPSSSGCVVFKQSAISIETGKPFAVSWNPDPVADKYQLQVLAFPPRAGGLPLKSVDVLGDPSATISIPRGGEWFLRVRSCKGADCSAWALSYDPAVTNPTAFSTGFFMIVRVASASGGTVE